MSELRVRCWDSYEKWYRKRFWEFKLLTPQEALNLYTDAFMDGFKDGHAIGQVAGRQHEFNTKKEQS